jgi:predicted AAA+ superfamily ATPase
MFDITGDKYVLSNYMHKRILDLSCLDSSTCFLWGPRQTGKSTLLRQRFPQAKRYDLLLADVYRQLLSRPQTIREECIAAGLTGANQGQPIIIDEVQKVPDVLDEVHWLIENRSLRFVLCGSSARKLKRGHANLLGGRALRRELHPLVFPEVEQFDLGRALYQGLLPPHYDSPSASEMLDAYVGDYLREEIAAEALTRNIAAFSRFLEVSALCNGEVVNYVNIARDCGVSAPTAKAYFEILQDTLLGSFLPALRRRAKRRLVEAPKFYFFDVGVLGRIAKRGPVEPGSELFGRALEHFIHQQLRAHAAYSGLHYELAYWRTASQIEVDFVLADASVAVEVKATTQASDQHLRGLRAFADEYQPRRAVLVSLDPAPRRVAPGIDILPWREFLERLWAGEIVK